MANFTGKYFKVRKVEDKGTVKIVDLGDGRKNQQGEKEYCTWFKSLFCGDAAKKPIAEGDTIEVTSGQIFQEKYNEKWSAKVKVFHFDVMESGGGSSQGFGNNTTSGYQGQNGAGTNGSVTGYQSGFTPPKQGFGSFDPNAGKPSVNDFDDSEIPF